MRPKEKTVSTLHESKKPLRNYFIAIFVLTFLLYGNSIKNNYALDDQYVTVTSPENHNNPRIEKGIKGIPEIFTTHYIEMGSQSFEYRPLVLVSFAIEYQFFGSNPYVSHFISVLLYAFTCMLLFSILCKLFREYNIVFPLLVTLLFLIHPIHTEVVDNIKCRDELLSFLFGLCSLHFLLKRTETNKWVPIILSGLFLLMALSCKKTAVMFVVLLPLTHYFFTKAKLKEVAPQFLVLVFVFLVFNLIQRILVPPSSGQRDFAFYENPLYYEGNFLTRVPAAFYTIGYYFKILVFPYPLSCYYGYDIISVTDTEFLFVIVSAIFYISTAIYATKKLKTKSIFSYGMFVFFIGLFPFANLITPVAGIVGDRYVYFASFGFCLLIAYLILIAFKIDYKNKDIGLKALKFSLTGFLVLVFTAFSVLVVARNNKWKDELTLFRNDLTHFQNSCNLHYILGNKLYDIVYITPKGAKKSMLINECQLHYKEAMELMKAGVQKYPNDFTSLNNIGMIYMKIFDDAFSAWPYFKRAMALNSAERIIQFNVAFCYEKRNLPDSAIMFYEKAIAANTTYTMVYLNLHELYIKQHKYAQAIVCDKKAIRQNPNKAQLWINLGNAYFLNKDTLNAVTQFMKAVECEPSNRALRTKMKDFLITIGQKDKAKQLN